MTTDNRSDLLNAISTEFCSCGLCQKVLRQPRILACFHTFCSDCLENVISGKKAQHGQSSFPCPVCSRVIPLQEGTGKTSLVEGLKLDSFTETLIEVLEAFRDEKKCDICLRRQVNLVASNWCMDCFDALCQECTKVHLCGKTTCSHIVLSTTELRKLSPENVMRRATSQRCAKHQEDLVKLYCLDCAQPVCVQCLASSHKKCDNCVPVSDARTAIQDDITAVLTRLHTKVATFTDENTPLQNGVNILNENIKQTEEEIRSLADDLRRKITQFEETLIEKLRSVNSQLLEKTGADSKKPEYHGDNVKLLASAETRMTALLKYGSDLDILDMYHNVKDTLNRVEGESSHALSGDRSLKLSFDVDETLKIFCRNFQSLGEIRVEDNATDDGLSSWGVTVTPRNEIIVVDGRNKRVQKFTSTGSLIDHIQLHEEPRDVTNFGQNDVAVTVTKKQILVLNLTGNMELKRRVKTQRQYDGIAFYGKLHCFLVSSVDESCIDIITTLGEVIKTFNANAKTSEPIFAAPRYVAFTREGDYVVSDTALNSVKCISNDGALLFNYAPDDGAHAMRMAQGVCCQKNGDVFVGDYGNSRVHLLTSNGSFQRFVTGRDSELRRPVALAMTQDNKLVVVQSDGIVKVFSCEGNTTRDEGQGIHNGKLGQGRHRFYSSTAPSLFRTGKSSRSLSESSDARSQGSSLSHHNFRFKHF